MGDERKIMANSDNFSVVEYPKKGTYALFSEDTMRFYLIRKAHWAEFYQLVLDANQAIKNANIGSTA